MDVRSDIFTSARYSMRWSPDRRPSKGARRVSTLSAILHQEPTPISQLVPRMLHDLEKIVQALPEG